MGAAAAVILIRERQIIEQFERVGATAPATARALDEFPVEPGGLGLRRLRARAVVREAAPGRFYADLEVWRALRRTRRRLVGAVLLIGALLLVYTLATSGLAGRGP